MCSGMSICMCICMYVKYVGNGPLNLYVYIISRTNTHTHTCVCVCVCVGGWVRACVYMQKYPNVVSAQKFRFSHDAFDQIIPIISHA
jgi:hypothetical protein